MNICKNFPPWINFSSISSLYIDKPSYKTMLQFKFFKIVYITINTQIRKIKNNKNK